MSITIGLVSMQFIQILIYIICHQHNYNHRNKEKGYDGGLLNNVSKKTLVWNGNNS